MISGPGQIESALEKQQQSLLWSAVALQLEQEAQVHIFELSASPRLTQGLLQQTVVGHLKIWVLNVIVDLGHCLRWWSLPRHPHNIINLCMIPRGLPQESSRISAAQSFATELLDAIHNNPHPEFAELRALLLKSFLAGLQEKQLTGRPA